MRIPSGSYAGLFAAYAGPLRGRMLLLAVLLFSSLGLQLYNPNVLAHFIDSARSGAPAGALLAAAVLFFAVAAAHQGLSVAAAYVSQDLGWRATNALRSDLTLHCLRLDAAFHHETTPGALIERVDGDVSMLAGFFSQFVIRVLGNALLLAGVLAVAFRIDWRAGLALTLLAAVHLTALSRIRHLAVPRWQATRQLGAEFFGFLQEQLAGIEDIRACGAETHVMRSFYDLVRRRIRAEVSAGRAVAAMLVVTFGLVALGVSTAFALGAWLVPAGTITVGTAYMIFFYTELLRWPIEQLAQQIQDLGRSGAAVTRVRELLQRRNVMDDGAGAPLPGGPLAVDLTSVTFGYLPEQPVVQGVTIHLAPGQVLGVAGHTGSGKTTVARLVARLHDPQTGTVRLSGTDVRDCRLADLRRRVGVVTQDVHLFKGTLRDNLTFFDRSIGDNRILAALTELGLGEWYTQLPRGLDTELASDGRNVSAGEAQLIALTRAFLQDPGVLILDEPSALLDPATERRLVQAVGRLLQGRTGIIIAHRLSTIARADLILVMADGRVAEFGPRQELAANPASHFHRLFDPGAQEVPA